MKKLTLALGASLIVSTACKPEVGKINYSGSELLGIDTSGHQAIAEMVDTPSSGQAARARGFHPQGGGLGLTQGGAAAFKAGDRVCISSSYGDAENAVKCGYLIVCKEMEGIQGQIPWRDGELCVQADCLPKEINGTYHGLELPGTMATSMETACHQDKGVPTAFSITRYFERAATFGLAADLNASGGIALQSGSSTDNSTYFGSTLYNKTSGSQGQSRVDLGGETLADEEILAVNYVSGSGSAFGLNGPSVNSEAKVGFRKNGLLSFIEFREGGITPMPASVSNVEGMMALTDDKELGIVPRKGKAPSPESLGLVRTRRGNVFELQGDSSMPVSYGPSGAVKVFVGSK